MKHEVKMGEDDNAMELDPEKFFRHFRFYLDTPANAERHGMEVKSKYKDQIASSCVFLLTLDQYLDGHKQSNTPLPGFRSHHIRRKLRNGRLRSTV